MRRDQLPLVTLDGRTAALRIAEPCDCGRQRCTLGLHVLLATRDFTPGPRAQSFEPSTARTWNGGDTDPPVDPTVTIDARFDALLDVYWHAALNLTRFIDAHRPNRWVPLPEPASDTDWCRNHLETIGQCEPRYRGDLCQPCYRLKIEHGHLPDADLMTRRHEIGYFRSDDINDWLTRLPKAKRRKRAG